MSIQRFAVAMLAWVLWVDQRSDAVVASAQAGSAPRLSPLDRSWRLRPRMGPTRLTGKGLSAAATILLFLAGGTFAAAQPTGPIAAYSFDEGAGASAGDTSGNAHTGVVAGAAWTSQGKFGSALSFDGVNDWVTVASTSSLALTNAMTLSAWVYPTTLGTWRTVILKERAGGLVYALYASDDSSRPSGYINNTGGADLDVTGTALSLNTWSHMAATYDGAVLRLYVNGTQIASRAASGSLLTSAGALRIGGNGVWGEYSKDGSMRCGSTAGRRRRRRSKPI